jgi:glycosyltransferase involved in cell wall biosynthesis
MDLERVPGMRIAYVLTSLGMGGAERLTLELAHALEARGSSVLLLVLRGRAEQEWPTGVQVVYLGMSKSPVGLLQGLGRARREMRAFRPDLVHAHTSFANIFARLLRLLYPAPVLSTVHNAWEGGWARTLLYRLTDPLSRLTVLVCRAAEERYVRIGAVPRRKCRVVLNAVDVEEFRPEAGRREAERREMGAGEGFVWLAAGRVSPAKDFPSLLRTFELVREQHSEAELWIAGGEAVNLALVGKGQTQLPAVQDGVRWLGLRREMAALLDAADGFVLSSAWEGMPLALAEAMAMEKPVVATDVGGVAELVGAEGRLVPAGDAVRLAEAMRAVMEVSAEARAAMGQGARRRIEQKFSMGPWIERWLAIYDETLR